MGVPEISCPQPCPLTLTNIEPCATPTTKEVPRSAAVLNALRTDKLFASGTDTVGVLQMIVLDDHVLVKVSTAGKKVTAYKG